MKVKLFATRGVDTIEPKINDFIKNKKIIDIKINSTDGQSEGFGVIAMIMYEDSKSSIREKTFIIGLGDGDDELNEFLKSHDVINVSSFGNTADEISAVVTYRED